MLNSRKPMVFVGAVVAGVIMLASTAFACTTFKGRQDVTAGGGTSQAWGDASTGMKHCTGSRAPTSNATVPTTGGVITVGAYPITDGDSSCPNSKLNPTKTTRPFPKRYHVYYVNRNGFVLDANGVWKWSVDCMASSGTRLAHADGGGDEIIIDGNGYSLGTGGTPGTRDYTVPGGQEANSTTDRAGVCISDTNDGEGNQVPLQVVAI